jgi:hypothetical protein
MGAAQNSKAQRQGEQARVNGGDIASGVSWTPLTVR